MVSLLSLRQYSISSHTGGGGDVGGGGGGGYLGPLREGRDITLNYIFV